MPYKDKNKHRENVRKNWPIWYKKNKKKRVEYFRQYRKDNKERLQAKWFVKNAILFKGLKKEPCEICGKKNVDAHHYMGYEKKNWLKVKWLCKIHHSHAHYPQREL